MEEPALKTGNLPKCSQTREAAVRTGVGAGTPQRCSAPAVCLACCLSCPHAGTDQTGIKALAEPFLPVFLPPRPLSPAPLFLHGEPHTAAASPSVTDSGAHEACLWSPGTPLAWLSPRSPRVSHVFALELTSPPSCSHCWNFPTSSAPLPPVLVTSHLLVCSSLSEWLLSLQSVSPALRSVSSSGPASSPSLLTLPSA